MFWDRAFTKICINTYHICVVLKIRLFFYCSGRKEELTFETVRSKKQGIGNFEMDFCQLDSSTPIKPQGGSGDYEKRSKRVASLFDQAVRRDQPKPCLESPDLTFVQDVTEKTYKESMRCPSTFYKTPEIIEDVPSFSQTSILKR